MRDRRPAARVAAAAAVLLAVATACGAGGAPNAAPAAGSQATGPGPNVPSVKGLNYGEPEGAHGEWLGSRWLRSDPGAGWSLARPRLQADIDFIASHHLGRTQRLFIGIDQLMVWDASTGFVRFDAAALGHLDEALDMFDARGLRVVAVVFDQEEVSSPGNFHLEALDGRHDAMRGGYLRAVRELFQRYGTRPTVVAWDLFNEAYNSLGQAGGLPRPPAEDPVSPGYPDATVHAWITDLYRTAKQAAPSAWLTVSDTTELYWKDVPDTAKYAGTVDFYDIHVYDDHPSVRDWRRTLDKPYLLGEVGGDIDHGFKDQTVNSRVVSFWLGHARELGIRAVLAHAGDGAVYSLRTGSLTPTGKVVEAAP
jgi:hypothetical protein